MSAVMTLTNVTEQEAEEFFQAYLEAAVFTGLGDTEEGESVPLDYLNYSKDDFSEQALADMRDDCDGFLAEYGDVIRDLDYGQRGSQWTNFELAGHDFLLTRQGHGAGFWDRGLGEIGDELTKGSKAYGDTWIYVGDDDQLHVM